MALIIMIMVFWAVNSFERERTYGYNLKKNAVALMIRAIEELRYEFISRKIKSNDSLAYGSFLIGLKESAIKTTSGSLISKQSVINPDFSAMIVEMLIELEIDSLDKVAISLTGSYPGANIAVLSALEVLNISAIVISSCGSSEYGATYPHFTWIDMEKYLLKKMIFSNSTTLASIGGGFDLGSQLDLGGKNICESSIYNNNIEFLNINNAFQNISKRMEHYDLKNDEISVYINVGGGVYSIGDSLARSSVPPGIVFPGDFEAKFDGTIVERFLHLDIPVININQINVLAQWYDLPYPPTKNHRYSRGNLFYSKKQYNLFVILTAFIISSIMVLFVGIISHREIKRRMHSSEPESFL